MSSIFSPAQTRKTILIGLALGLIASILIVMIGQAHAGPIIVCTQYGCAERDGDNRARDFSARRHPQTTRDFDSHGNDTVIIGGRPAGCPQAYCGCGLRKHLGLSDKRLNLADNWRRLFARTHAKPGAVAVRTYHRRGYGHVMLLVRHVANSIWVVRDYNSGGGLSRIHTRSVRGYSFVDPTTKVAYR